MYVLLFFNKHHNGLFDSCIIVTITSTNFKYHK